ncbi:MAG: microcystin degradation protein MlrC [Planctomycetaceae bacterium]|nr:microcystin degradation protein MlrC [Planctomycetaceae bacterium]
MRIAIAEIAQETDSFSPMVADIHDFEAFGLYYGAEILEKMRNVGPLGGLFQVADEQQQSIEWLPIIRAWAGAGGTITAETLDYLTERLVTGLKAALPLDAVFLALHGAAASEKIDDVEGHLLSAVREIVGNQIPVIVNLDHHANITQRMVQHASVLIGHETQPHDTVDSGRKTARVLFSVLEGKAQPSIAWQKIPMITPQDHFLTAQGPMKEWFDLAREMEHRPGVLDVSPYPMQPWLDVEEGGWAVVVHTDNDPELAKSLAAESAAKAWSLRDRFWASSRVAPADAVREAVVAERGLIILSDTGDSVYGGAPGDSTVILRELLAQQIPCVALLPVVDVAAVEAAMSAGVGGQVSLEIGGHIDAVFSQPVRVAGRVAAVSKGVTLELPDRGACDLGRTALLEVGQLRIVLLEQRTFAINHPTLYTHLGLDIADAKMVVLKTASNFQFFNRWRTGLIRVDSQGMTQSDLKAFDWKRIPRPMYPLD